MAVKQMEKIMLDDVTTDAEGVKIAPPPAVHKHLRRNKSIYGDQLICLCALLVMGVWRWGWRALVICAVGVLSSIFADWVCCRLTRKTYNPRDLSTVVSGMCLGLMLPASVGYGYVVFGCTLAMGIKHVFGGKNNYIFNPACLSYAFLAICYPGQVLMFPNIGETLPVFGSFSVPLSSGLDTYLVQLGITQELSPADVLLGNFLGAIGTTHVLVLAVCGICLMFRRALSPIVTLVAFSSFVGLSFLFPSYDNISSAIIIELISGNILFGLIFLASDPQTMPKSLLGRIYYGLLIGVFIVTCRHLSQTETGFVFVLLVANAVSLHIDRFADKTIVFAVNTARYLKRYAGNFERVRKEALSEEDRKHIGDTQEIIVPLMNYNMPAIDNKIIKADKSAAKKVASRSSGKKTESFMTSLRRNMKRRAEAGSSPKPKKAVAKQFVPIKQPKPRSEQKNNKQGEK